MQDFAILPKAFYEPVVSFLVERGLEIKLNSWELYNRSQGRRAVSQPGSGQATPSAPSLGTGFWKGKIGHGGYSFLFNFFFPSPPPPPFFFPGCFASPERNRLNVILTLNGGKRGRRWERRRKIHLLQYCQPLSFPSSLTGPGLKVWLQWPDSTH